jgi:putative alpha-1,2-mannosidase
VDNGRKFIVKAINLSDQNIYIQSVMLNGQPWNKTYITHEDLMKGGELIFNMASKPNKKWGTSKESRPYSVSTDEL